MKLTSTGANSHSKIRLETMKINITAISVFVLIYCSLVFPQPKAPQNSNPPTIPCPANYLYVPARDLLANRTEYAMPKYPPTAIEGKIQGDVALRVLIDNQGRVKDFEARKGNPVLTVAAAEAVTKWKYKPFAVNPGQKGIESLIVLTFRLLGDNPLVEDKGPPESVDVLDAALRIKKLCLAAPVMEGNLIHRVDPEYPATAKAARVHGNVVIEALIDKSGNIARATVLSGPALLADSALKAVKQWKYRPYTQGGQPVEVESTITVHFHI